MENFNNVFQGSKGIHLILEKLSGRENLSYFASLYKHTLPIEPLLESVGLAAEADKKVSA
ncbi:hypothetical protein [Sphaerochaeta sp. S2]|uniref:hypothetical protein n=1 Tax=Sphaerochaeta sp. S2 TaxID=2798868 RepID=UPI001E2A0604|nr:hypothetical protein [Sphaerochaeta sp. S2]